MRMRAAVLRDMATPRPYADSQPIQIEEVDLAPPREGEVLVKIAGAGLDVWWIPHWWDPTWNPEINQPSRYPFWELENVISTSHNVSAVEKTKYSNNALDIIIKNIKLIAEGKPPINQVDKEHRY